MLKLEKKLKLKNQDSAKTNVLLYKKDIISLFENILLYILVNIKGLCVHFQIEETDVENLVNTAEIQQNYTFYKCCTFRQRFPLLN